MRWQGWGTQAHPQLALQRTGVARHGAAGKPALGRCGPDVGAHRLLQARGWGASWNGWQGSTRGIRVHGQQQGPAGATLDPNALTLGAAEQATRPRPLGA